MNQPLKIHVRLAPPQKGIHCDACASRLESVFCSLSKDQAKELDHFKADNIYKKGQILFYEGNPASGIYCVYSGQVKLYKTGALGRQQIVGIATHGDVLGYRSLFAEKPNSVTAEAIEDSAVCFIDKRAFLQIIARDPSVTLNIVKKLSQDMESIEDKIMDLVDKPAHVRLARLLLMLKETYGRPGTGGTTLDISLSRQEIAEMIGTTQETTIRLLSRFRKRGLVDLDRRTITIQDSEALFRTARLSD